MIGVLVDNVDSGPQSYVLFRELNKLSKNHNVYLFANKVNSLPLHNKFCILQQLEALSHKGHLIGTSIVNSQIVAKSLTPKQKYLYLWYPEWVEYTSLETSQLKTIMHNDEMNILARSISHYDLISKLFKQPKHVIYNWKAEQIEGILND